MSENDVEELLSRYRFTESRQLDLDYSFIELKTISGGIYPTIYLEKILRIRKSTLPIANIFLRMLKIYFYIERISDSEVLPLEGILVIDHRINNELSPYDENAWQTLSSANVAWTFHNPTGNTNPDDKYNQIRFSPISIETLEDPNAPGTVYAEIRMRFLVSLPLVSTTVYYLWMRGQDNIVMDDGAVVTYYPSMAVSFTVAPIDTLYQKIAILEIIDTLLNIGINTGIYSNTEFDGAAERTVRILPFLIDSQSEILEKLASDLECIRSSLSSPNFTNELKSQKSLLNSTLGEMRGAWAEVTILLKCLLQESK